MKRLFFAVFVLLLLYSPNLLATEKNGSDAMIGHDVDMPDITACGITPGISTMGDVEKRLGAGEFYTSGSGQRASLHLCYVSSKERDFTKVVFESPASTTAALTDRIVASIKIYAGDVRYDSSDKCVSSKLVDSHIVTGAGVGLGLSPAMFKEKLGKPTEEWPGYVGYEYHALKNLTPTEVTRLKVHWPFVLKYPYVDIYSSIEARFYKNSLKRLDLMRIVAKP